MLEVIVVDKTEKVNTQLVYPILMKSTDSSLLVLFTSEEEGTVLVKEGCWRVGEHSDSWIPATNREEWMEFKGHIVLENK